MIRISMKMRREVIRNFILTETMLIWMIYLEIYLGIEEVLAAVTSAVNAALETVILAAAHGKAATGKRDRTQKLRWRSALKKQHLDVIS